MVFRKNLIKIMSMRKGSKAITVITNAQTDYSFRKVEQVPGFQEFQKLFDQEYLSSTKESFARGEFPSAQLKELADGISAKYTPANIDNDLQLTKWGYGQTSITGTSLRSKKGVFLPKMIYVAPNVQSKETLEGLKKGWRELENVKVLEDSRIKERDLGLIAEYGDWKLMAVLNPQEGLALKFSTLDEFKPENGESLLDVRERVRSFVEELIGEPGVIEQNSVVQMPENIMVVTNSLVNLAIRGNFENWDKLLFLEKLRRHQSKNSAVSIYRKVGDSFTVDSAEDNFTPWASIVRPHD